MIMILITSSDPNAAEKTGRKSEFISAQALHRACFEASDIFLEKCEDAKSPRAGLQESLPPEFHSRLFREGLTSPWSETV